MKKADNVQQGNGNVQNMPGTSSPPKSAANDTGVTPGIGIPNAASNKKNNPDNSGKDNQRNRPFSNERPIF